MADVKNLHNKIDSLYNKPLEPTESFEAVSNLVEFFSILMEADQQQRERKQ